MDKRLFLPAQWCSDADAERRHQGKGPDAVALHTRPPLAADLVQALRNAGRLPFRDVVADGL